MTDFFKVGPMSAAQNAPEVVAQFTPADLLRQLHRRWRTIAGITAALVVLTVIMVSGATPRYVAYSQILLGEQGLSARNSFDLVENQQASLSASVIEGELAVLRSNALLGRVARRLKLNEVAEFNPALDPETNQPSLSSRIKTAIKSMLPGGDDEEATDAEPSDIERAATTGTTALGEVSDIVAKLSNNISVRQLGTSYVVQVTVDAQDPLIAAAIANTLMEEYISFLSDKRFEAAQRFTHWLENRVADLAVNLEASEREVFQFRAKMEADADSRDRLDQQMRELTTRLVDQRAQLSEAEAMYSEFQETVKRSGPLGAADLLASDMILELRAELESLKQRETVAIAAFGEDSSQLAAFRRNREKIEESISTEVVREMGRLQNRQQVLTIVAKSLETALNDMARQIMTQSGEEIQLNQLQRVAEANQAVYGEFLARFKEISEIQNLETPDADIIAYASPPEAPSFPRKKLSVALAMFGGLFAGAAWVVATERLPQRIRSAGVLAQVSGHPVYGRVPGPPAGMAAAALLTELKRNPQGALAQSAHQLAANADLRSGGQAHSVLLSAAIPGDDKSLVALMIGWAATQKGRRCVVLDLDTRRATLSQMLGQDKPRSSIAKALYGEIEIGAALMPLADTGIDFVASTVMQSDPTVLLDTERFRQIMAELAARYDTVIFDGPVQSAPSETFQLADKADVGLLVVRARTLTAAELAPALALARSAPVRSLGMVLTADEEAPARPNA